MTRSIISHENVAEQEIALKGPKHEIFESEFFLHKSDLYG
jgi:hypothetical protein